MDHPPPRPSKPGAAKDTIPPDPSRPADPDTTQGLESEPTAAPDIRPESLPDLPDDGGHGETAPYLGNDATAAEDKPDRPAPAKKPKVTTLGDFRILNKLGGGGMGTVYRAHQISLDRDVAVKILAKHLGSNPRFVQRFLREARVMAQLDHPNILRCFEVKQERGLHYYAMEYVTGGSVEAWARKLGQLSVGDALYITLACARGLQHAHDNGMIHRDIKPENVLVTSKGVIKVADLGLVKALEDDLSLTDSGVGVGTPSYMAPEQTRNAKHADARSDIYSLGCMLYRLLTGKLPFKGDTIPELLEAKESQTPPPARKANPEVPAHLDLILDKMMAKRPEQRYTTCAELIADLEKLNLASPKLSFIGPGGGSATHRPAAAAPPAPEPPKARPPSKPSLYEPEEVDTSARWYLSMKSDDGRLSTRKLTTIAVINLIHRGELKPETPACQEMNGNYRPLSSYHQFTHLLRPQVEKDRASRKKADFKSVYDKLESDDKKRRRWRWLRDMVVSVGGFVKLMIWLAIIGVLGVVLYFGIMWGIDWLHTKGDKLNVYERPAEGPSNPNGGR